MVSCTLFFLMIPSNNRIILTTLTWTLWAEGINSIICNERTCFRYTARLYWNLALRMENPVFPPTPFFEFLVYISIFTMNSEELTVWVNFKANIHFVLYNYLLSPCYKLVNPCPLSLNPSRSLELKTLPLPLLIDISRPTWKYTLEYMSIQAEKWASVRLSVHSCQNTHVVHKMWHFYVSKA